MILTELAAHLAGQLPHLMMGKTLFVERIPTSAVDGVMLRVGVDGIQIDHETGLRKGTIAVILRASTTSRGNEGFEHLSRALLMEHETQLGGYLVKRLEAQTEPRIYPISEGNNVEFSVNYSIVYAIIK